jgi:hypothetical protein
MIPMQNTILKKKENETRALTSVQTALGLMQYASYFLKWTVLNLEMKSHTNSG